MNVVHRILSNYDVADTIGSIQPLLTKVPLKSDDFDIDIAR